MWAQSNTIAAGDVVILWLTREDVQSVIVTPGKELNGRYGVYRHADLVGVPYGSKLSSRNGRGFIHVLRPTPELWTLALPHRTQILYHADISYIVMWLAIKPGSVVIEAGTGSGSFSHSVARTIGTTGRLHSFEFHEQRANKARDEFARHGMSDFVKLEHRNVCKDGFGLQDQVDSVFLDLPAPWEAVASAKTALRKDCIGRICCFSPCMEQVLRTVSALNELGFTGVTMHETHSRPHDVCNMPMQTVGDVAARLRETEIRKEERRLKQIEASYRDRKRKRPEDVDDDLSDNVTKHAKTGDPEPSSRIDDPVVTYAPKLGPSMETGDTEPTKETSRSKHTPHHPNAMVPANSDAVRYIVSKPFGEVRGHTSYLTFAMLVPSSSSLGDPPIETRKATADKTNDVDEQQDLHGANDAPSIDETNATFDSLIARIPEEELARMLDPPEQ